jgi:hypothetical protein
MDTDELLVVLLTGGGLALIGTVLGALITQVFAVRIGRENRREERRMAVKSFQRDTLVALQDSVADVMGLSEVARDLKGGPEAEYESARTSYRAETLRVRMLASRIRDDELRSATKDFLEGHDAWLYGGSTILTRTAAQKLTASVRAIYDRAGHLIRTLDAIDEAT